MASVPKALAPWTLLASWALRTFGAQRADVAYKDLQRPGCCNWKAAGGSNDAVTSQAVFKNPLTASPEPQFCASKTLPVFAISIHSY